MSQCLREVAGLMVDMLSTQEARRPLSSRYSSLIASIDPADLMLDLRVNFGSFGVYAKLAADVVNWAEVAQPEQPTTLYRLILEPGATPQYFTVAHGCVCRILPPSRAGARRR